MCACFSKESEVGSSVWEGESEGLGLVLFVGGGGK